MDPVLDEVRDWDKIRTQQFPWRGRGGGEGVNPHVFHWQGWQNDDAPLRRPFWDKNISALFKGIRDLVTSLSIPKIKKLSCQAVSGLGVVGTNKWWLSVHIFIEVYFPLNPSFDREDSKHELTWNTVEMMGSLVAMVITQLLVSGASVNSSNTWINTKDQPWVWKEKVYSWDAPSPPLSVLFVLFLF